MVKQSAILHLDLTSKDEALKEFWNEVSQEFHALLWLPRKTVSQEQGSVSSKRSLNYTEEKSDYLKKKLTPKTSIRMPLLVSSQVSLTPTMVKELQSEEVLITRKIRIYPKNESKFISALHTYRRAYNLTVEAINSGATLSSELRRSIADTIKEESPDVYDVNLIQEAYRKCNVSFRSVISKRKKGLKATLSFMSWKYSPRYFQVFRLGKGGSIYIRSLGEVTYTEKPSDYAIGKSTTIIFENGEWYACTQDKLTTKGNSNSELSIVALDPGVRTFMTSFSDSTVVKYGDSFQKDKLLSIALRIRKLYSNRQCLLNTLEKDQDTPQWFSDRMRTIEKAIAKLKSRRIHLIEDMHNRVAYDLVMSHDIILLPTFQVSNMVKKKKRSIGKKIVNSMIDLCHYKFKLRLKWMAKKYGKIVLDVNEAYTSKTFKGNIINIGDSKVIKSHGKEDKTYYYDRDINGARNILIRFLTHSYINVL